MDKASLDLLRTLDAVPRKIGIILSPQDIRNALTPDEYDLYTRGYLRVEEAPDEDGAIVCVSSIGREALAEHGSRIRRWLLDNLSAIITSVVTSLVTMLVVELVKTAAKQ